MYKSVVKPTMLYRMETVAVTKRQVGKMEVAELKMVRWALGVTRKDKKRICERDCKNCKAGRQTSECKATLVWTRKKERRLHGEKGIRKRERPRRRWMDLVREYMERVGAREGDEVDQVKWRLLSHHGNPK